MIHRKISKELKNNRRIWGIQSFTGMKTEDIAISITGYSYSNIKETIPDGVDKEEIAAVYEEIIDEYLQKEFPGNTGFNKWQWNSGGRQIDFLQKTACYA